ncbi:DUF6603 domain-containing protein [Natrinema marinum]|uniref:DUF6603 domain-containing protein n=1 Tax=Natrinema marinum TaxID=2961598 RepID=UPI0020C8C0EB|nr:DUF6603 domain-containing protein [Natrinema marinum]
MADDESQSTDGGAGTEDVLIRELSRVFEPVEAAVEEGPAGIISLLIQADVPLEGVTQAYETIEEVVSDVASVYQTVQESIQNESLPSPEEIKDVFDTIQGLDDIELPELEDLEDVDVPGLGTKLLDYLFVRYLQTYQQSGYRLLRMGNVIVIEDVESDGEIGQFVPQNIPKLVQDPGAAVAAALQWGTSDFRASLTMSYLYWLFRTFGLFPRIEDPFTKEQADLIAGEDSSDSNSSGPLAERDLPSQLAVPVVAGPNGEYGFKVVPVPETPDHYPGVALVPYTPFDAFEGSTELDLGDDWTFSSEFSVERTDWGLVVRPPKEGDGTAVDFRPLDPDAGDLPAEVHGEASLTYDGTTEDGEFTPLLGTAGGSRLALGSIAGKTSFDYDDDFSLAVELPAEGEIGVSPSDFDGFLKKVLPNDGLFYNFDVTVGWSSTDGLYFERGGTLEASIPQSVDLGPVSMREIYLATLQPGGEDEGGSDDASLSLAGAATGEIELGPLVGTIKRMGVSADVAFPENQDGNLGVVDVDLGFKPPEGIGLSIDGGVVTGGGYLEFDYENDRYAGVLQLQAGSLSINAIGLLTTQLPNGRDGFSLLILIAGEFDAVQLGFGFTLEGVGGLLGINRSVKAKPLGTAVRSGNLDSVLFPTNPVANAQRIISDLRSIFPPTAGKHVFGPMAKLGWGTPTLVSADLGLVLELPTGKFVLLGALHTNLPDEDLALIALNMGVSGVLDPPNKRASIDASLYDSRVVQWTISGDMAMRSRWGENPRFVLAVGGFNPRFDPPDDFPQLDRVKASMGVPGGNPKLEFAGYFALTSNTVQAGAGLHFLAEAGPAKVEGKFTFDALIQFDPFKFIVDFLAKLAVTIKGKGLTLKLDGTLSGPSPFRVTGTLHIEILCFDITVDINVTIGSSKNREKLPRARLFPKLLAELETPGNWTAQLPADGDAIATFRETDDDEDTVLAHPTGTIGVRQTVTPLEREIEKFGNASPTGYTKFAIEAVGGDVDLSDDLFEQFAPAQYLELTDSQKMESPAFESMRAGREMRHPGLYPGYRSRGQRAANVVSTELGYECTVVDRPRGNWGTPLQDLGKFRSQGLDHLSGLSPAVADALSNVGAVANGDLRTAGTNRFRLSDDGLRQLVSETGGLAKEFATGTASSPSEDELSESVSVSEPTYTVVRADDMSEAGIVDGEVNKSEAQRALTKRVEDDPGAAGAFQVVESYKARTASVAAETAVADGGEDLADEDTHRDVETAPCGTDRGPEVYL